MKNKKYPLVIAIVRPADYNGRAIRGTALNFCKARETKKFYFIEWTPTRDKKYPKLETPLENGRLSECECGTEKIQVGFSKSYIFDPTCEFVQGIKKTLIEKRLNEFKDQPIV